MNWDPDFYKTGYEGYEVAENFPSVLELEQYRQHLIQKSEHQVNFIARHLGWAPGSCRLRVVEFCSGNGRLLVSLAMAGLLDYGLGLEIARSRVGFAQQWVADLGLTNVNNVVADVLGVDEVETDNFDLAVCITGAFQYFRPIREKAPAELLAKMRDALAPEGRLLLELYQLPDHRQHMLALNDGRLRTWQPLPPEDRFAYYLDDFEYWDKQKILRHEKIFIGRDGRIDAGRVEMLAYYTATEMDATLQHHGFDNIEIYADFEDSPYHEGQASSLVILAWRSK
jgi:SAM-dependent methyltransferase